MPNTPNYEREPALTIGEIFANKAMLKTYVSAFIGLAASLLKFTVTDVLIEDISTVVMFVAMAWTPIMAQIEKKSLATEQAKDTREVVYSPATVKEIAQASADAGTPQVPPPPAK